MCVYVSFSCKLSSSSLITVMYLALADGTSCWPKTHTQEREAGVISYWACWSKPCKSKITVRHKQRLCMYWNSAEANTQKQLGCRCRLIQLPQQTSNSTISVLKEFHKSVPQNNQNKISTLESTQIQFCTVLSSQEWPLLLLNRWAENPMPATMVKEASAKTTCSSYEK